MWEQGDREVSSLHDNAFNHKYLCRSIYGHIDFLGKGATTLVEDVSAIHLDYTYANGRSLKSQYTLRIEQELPDLNFFFLSDVWLDHVETFNGLRKMFDNCVEANFIPKVIVLCGNFTTRGISHGSSRDLLRYQGAHFKTFLALSIRSWPFRELWLTGGPGCFISTDYQNNAFRPGTRPSRRNSKRHPSPKTYSLLTPSPSEIENPQTSPCNKSLQNQVF